MLIPSASRVLRRAAVTAPRTAFVAKRYGSGEPHYNEPTGELFGEKPLAPGEKRVREGWETMFVWGFIGSMGLASVMLYYKPDTSIQSWALKEAKERMEARGDKYLYEPSTPSTSS